MHTALHERVSMENRILLLDDEPNILASLKRILMDEPYEILGAGTGEEGLEILLENPCKVVISDERMPGMGGAEFLSRVKALYPETIRIMLTGYASIEAAMKAVNDGEIYRFFMKPWDDTDLRMAIHSAIEKFDLQKENERLLELVRKQSGELSSIESRYPGITQIEKDSDGSIFVPELSEEEMSELLKECNISMTEENEDR
jgi:two-component system, probable response regulator PhcQ